MKINTYFSTKQRRYVLLCVIAYVALNSFQGVPALAQDLGFKPDLKSAGWETHTPRGKEAAQFEVLDDGSLKITARQAVAFLYRFVPKAESVPGSLSWDWRIDQTFPATDLSVPGQDDRPLAIHVYFTDQNAGVLKRFGSGLAGLFGVPVSGRAITYIWGGQHPDGMRLPNPFMDDGDGVLVIRRSGMQSHTGEWVSESVDLVADYQQAFGAVAPPVSVVAVSADTDDTGATSQALVRNLRLMPTPISAR